MHLCTAVNAVACSFDDGWRLSMGNLIIARHGRTEANATGLLLGHLDVPLDEVGEAQARALATAIGPVDRVISSPLLRTRQTAAAISAEFGLEVEIDDRWVELDYGEFDGLPLGEVPGDMWREWRHDPLYTPPGGESLAALETRVRGALVELAGQSGDHTVVVVSHVSPIKAAAVWALDVDYSTTWRLFVSPGSITRIMVTADWAILQSFNEVVHLSDQK